LKTNRTFAQVIVLTSWSAISVLGFNKAYAQDQVLNFETHAEFFSDETHQKQPLDPQVFVVESAADGALGPQGIYHVAGLRNALISDEASLPIRTATGKPIGMTLGQWLAATGTVIVRSMPNGREKVVVIASGLEPNGHYSLFENHFDRQPVGFTPLDSKGVDNSFVANADGRAVITVVAPTEITHQNAVLLVYHSDGKAHGSSRGEIGVTAHHQMIARP
jgi:hypothetical protein